MNINKLIEYIEQNFRKTLYRMDFEILENISEQNYSERQIIEAVKYCNEHNTDSIRYLQKVLLNQKQEVKTSWLDKKQTKESLNAEDKKWAEKVNAYYDTITNKK